VDLVIVRHAEPIRIDAHETGGAPADPGLTTRGHDQSRRLAAWLAHEHFDQLIVSPKRRAIETAAPVAEQLTIKPSIVDDLVEYDRNADYYIPIEEMRATNDPRFTAMIEGRWEDFGGESPTEFRERMASTLDRIIAGAAGGRVLAVCHGGVCNLMLAIVAGLDRQLWFEPGYTSISRIVASRRGVRSVVSINETAHLYAERMRA